jgi:hypothetical protein
MLWNADARSFFGNGHFCLQTLGPPPLTLRAYRKGNTYRAEPANPRLEYVTGNIESGEYESAAELAKAEKVNDSYLSRALRLTLLAPEIVEAIVTGQQPRHYRSMIF